MSDLETIEFAQADVVDVENEPERETERRSKRRRWLRAGITFIVLAIVSVALWPAQYGGWTGLTIVNGHSMEPTYHTGDLVISIREPSYDPGQIVSYLVPKGQDGAGGRVIHRVMKATGTGDARIYTTQGDNNNASDPWHFHSTDVLGKAVLMIPSVGNWFSYVTNPVVLGLLSGLVVASTVWRIGRGPKKPKSRAGHKH